MLNLQDKGVNGDCSLYPLGEWPTTAESKALGITTSDRILGSNRATVHAKPTGEFRCPKAGEWYLSGAEVRAYHAPNNLMTKFYICKLVRTKTKTVVVEQ